MSFGQGDKIRKFIYLRRSPSQLYDVLEIFSYNLEVNLDTIANKNAYLIVIFGDFNAKSSNWYKHDKIYED